MSKPKIILCGENLPENVSDAEKILVESGIGVYQRDGKLVLVGNFPRHGDKPSLEFVTISKERLIDLFTTIITFEKQEGEEKKNVACPHYIAAIYLSREGEWRLSSTARGFLAMAEWLRGRPAEAGRAFASSIAG